MKKVSLQSLVSYLTETGALPEVKAEIEAELANMEKREGLPSSRPARAKKPRKERATK